MPPSSIFAASQPFVLASASPRRHELLAWLGFDFTIRTAETEARPRAEETPQDYAARAALEKAGSVLGGFAAEERLPVVLGADTIVIMQGKIFGKPRDHSQALAMLRELSGRTHEVITACALLLPPQAAGILKNKKDSPPAVRRALAGGARQAKADARLSAMLAERGCLAATFRQRSRVGMWQCPEEALAAYAAGDEPLDKAGAYAVQGKGGFLIRKIYGSWSNVVGLPVSELAELMLGLGIIIPAPVRDARLA